MKISLRGTNEMGYRETHIFGGYFNLAIYAVETKIKKIRDCEIQFLINLHNKHLMDTYP